MSEFATKAMLGMATMLFMAANMNAFAQETQTQKTPVADTKPTLESESQPTPAQDGKPGAEGISGNETKSESGTNPDETPNAVATPDGTTVTANKPIIGHSAAMTAIHNAYRTEFGLSPQDVDPGLSNVAQQWAEHMASVGSMYHGSGEQIIAYSGGDTSYDAGFRTWLGSSPHRAWLCSRAKHCGFGYAIGANGCAYYAGAFGNAARERETVSAETGVFQSASYSSGRQSRRSRRR